MQEISKIVSTEPTQMNSSSPTKNPTKQFQASKLKKATPVHETADLTGTSLFNVIVDLQDIKKRKEVTVNQRADHKV